MLAIRAVASCIESPRPAPTSFSCGAPPVARLHLPLRETPHPMKIPRWTLRAAALVLGLAAGTLSLHAQGVTTGAIAGTVTDAAGAPVEGAVVLAVAKTNGFTTSTTTRANGYYIIPNLET